MNSIMYGLLAALGWGSGDFVGGIASRKTGAYRAVFYGELVGVIFLLLILVFIPEPFPDTHTLTFSAIAGFLGTFGLIFLYQSMTLGLMSIAAPVSALLAVTIPVIVGMVTDGIPEYLTMIGFGFAIFAVWNISQSEDGIKDILSHLSDLKLPLLAGIGFGTYFVLMHEATANGGVIWPMMLARLGGMVMITAYMFISQSPWKVTDKSAWPIITLNGILDVSGNLFFILGSQVGRLDVVAVLSSLFPGATVLWALIFLKEHLSRRQWVGIFSALTAIVLLTI